MDNDFYRAFEEKYRGSRDLILSRLRAYLPFVGPLAKLYKEAPVIDLGCGRGEWLQLMAENGFKPHGVDLDEGMLGACRGSGFHAEKGDAVAWLATLPNESQAVVSAIHFVEHITFEQLQSVVSESLRVLKPGGLLIMETPNPENIIVATQNFYFDPTHRHLIPAKLLSFLPEYYGFARVKTLRLQESKDLLRGGALSLSDVLGGISPDYAVIAQKSGVETFLKTFDAVFAGNYGLDFETLVTNYHAQRENRVKQIETKTEQAVAKAEQAAIQGAQAEAKAEQVGTEAQEAVVKAWQAEAKAEQAGTEAQEAVVKAWQAEAKAEQARSEAQAAVSKAQQAQIQAEQAAAKADQAERAIHAIYASRSWNLTAPLRWMDVQIGKFLQDRKQGFFAPVWSVYRKFSGQYPFSVKTSVKKEIASKSPEISPSLSSVGSEAAPLITAEQLTPRARKIYADFKAVIKKNNEAS
ncbi:MAG TPA: methyltransferase domain-containing protein [Candidatus Omnitrophota bacterium]|nr:methyltransferase domain-containing protein [Candidatus Omnitrophota bacterium]HPS36811.1 methyltransferase domain-containing protein [Candidatus Omnitrophota bacterium]